MKRTFFAATLVALGLIAAPTFAKDLPTGGMTVEEVAKWLQDGGYKAEIVTAKDGTKSIKTADPGAPYRFEGQCRNPAPTKYQCAVPMCDRF